MYFRRNAALAALFTFALSASAVADKKHKGDDSDTGGTPAAQKDGKRRDPKGIKGISPFWEALKKGDDALSARDVDGAIAAYQEAIKDEPQNPMGHYRMGEAQLTKGNLKDAEGFWQSALRFVGENAALKAKILFVLADAKERDRSFEEATNGWNAYEAHSKAATTVKTYPATPVERRKVIQTWNQLVIDYGAVKERIKTRLEEAEKKAAESAQSPQNR